jgi:hypothetical protein
MGETSVLQLESDNHQVCKINIFFIFLYFCLLFACRRRKTGKMFSRAPSSSSPQATLVKSPKESYKAASKQVAKKSVERKKRKYDDGEAECSDGSQDELEDEVDEYDYEDGFLQKEDVSDGDEDAVAELRGKQMMEDDSKTKQLPKFKKIENEDMPNQQPAGNKKLKTWMPTEKPSKVQKAKLPEYRWCFLITDPKSFKNFLRAASAGGSLPALHFRFEIKTSPGGETTSFLTLQAFDSPPTMGYYSSMKIILQGSIIFIRICRRAIRLVNTLHRFAREAI